MFKTRSYNYTICNASYDKIYKVAYKKNVDEKKYPELSTLS